MNPKDLPQRDSTIVGSADEPSLLSPLLHGHASAPPTPGAVVGRLVALTEDGCAAMVTYAGAGGAVLSARTTVDLRGAHIGQDVLLVFANNDTTRPIVTGVLRGRVGWPLPDTPAQVEVDTDGQRMIVGAKEQLILRCGRASITLTKAGKVLIEGSYLLSRSTGANRIKGGSVQIN